MNMDKLLAKEDVGKRLRYLREDRGLKQEDPQLFEKTSINRKKLGRLEAGKQLLNHEEVIAVADFYKISCDALLRGVTTQCYGIERVTGLTNGAIKYLYKLKRNSPEMLDIINDILGNNKIAEPLIESFYIYAMLDLPSFVNLEDGTPVGRVTMALSDEQTILKNIVADYLHEILVLTRSNYEGKRYKQTDKKVELALEKFKNSMREIENQNWMNEDEWLQENSD